MVFFSSLDASIIKYIVTILNMLFLIFAMIFQTFGPVNLAENIISKGLQFLFVYMCGTYTLYVQQSTNLKMLEEITEKEKSKG